MNNKQRFEAGQPFSIPDYNNRFMLSQSGPYEHLSIMYNNQWKFYGSIEKMTETYCRVWVKVHEIDMNIKYDNLIFQ